MCSDFHRAESGTQLLARLEGRSSLKEIEPYLFADEDSSVHGDVLEFHGPEGTGKTEMLYHLTARCVLPKSEGGLEAEVVFVDTDYHFDLLRLVAILERRLARGSEEAVRRCLGRVSVLSCGGDHRLVVLATTQSLLRSAGDRPPLCRAWQRAVTRRVVFSKHDDLKASARFSLVSRHLKSNRVKKHAFIIGESGIEFC
ncbi:DNA repair protein XRCC2 [Suricata suricatta]|uniref:DNA repair protein XRCC2 n=1 Tax=Suricata suricatta TaxID=37032 RepID=UPI001155AAC3|nr:DNA repair protein XRCC2 [Suricata suricatta]